MIIMTHNDVKQTSINEHIRGYFTMVLRFVAMIASPQRTIQHNGESLGQVIRQFVRRYSLR